MAVTLLIQSKLKGWPLTPTQLACESGTHQSATIMLFLCQFPVFFYNCPPHLPAEHQEACAETARTTRHNTVKDESQPADFTQAAKSTPECHSGVSQ